MATLLNRSLRAARWRTFNQGSIGTLLAAAELDLPPGGSVHYLHPQGAFNAEVREPVLLTTRASPLLTLTVNAGAQEQFTVPLGLPLALSHVALVLDAGQVILVGYGDNVLVRANGTVELN